MRTVQRLFDEVAAALQFPHYFGENWPALNECLEDMDWMPLSQGVALVLLEASQVLVDEPAELEVLVRSIVNANMTYAQPIDEGEWWDRPAVPFHVVLHGAVGEAAFIAHRWGESGASVTPFPS